MTATEVFEVGGAVLLSLGGASALLFGLSSWLGKVWAERILSREKAEQAKELEDFKKRLLLDGLWAQRMASTSHRAHRAS